jgi:hypothetical protein
MQSGRIALALGAPQEELAARLRIASAWLENGLQSASCEALALDAPAKRVRGSWEI